MTNSTPLSLTHNQRQQLDWLVTPGSLGWSPSRKVTADCMRAYSWRQYQDGSWDSVWDIDEDYSNNKHCTSKWSGLNLQSELKQAFRHVLCLEMLGVKNCWCIIGRIWSSVVVIGFGINLCVFQWTITHVRHVFGLDKISLSRTVCLATWCVVISTETSWLHLFTFLIFTREGIRSLAGDICWRYLCLISRLLSDESLKWTVVFFFFFLSLVCLLLLQSWLCAGSHHTEYLPILFVALSFLVFHSIPSAWQEHPDWTHTRTQSEPNAG